MTASELLIDLIKTAMKQGTGCKAYQTEMREIADGKIYTVHGITLPCRHPYIYTATMTLDGRDIVAMASEPGCSHCKLMNEIQREYEKGGHHL